MSAQIWLSWKTSKWPMAISINLCCDNRAHIVWLTIIDIDSILAKNCEVGDVHMVVGYRIMTHFYTKFDYCFSARNQFKFIRNCLRLGLRPRPRWGSLRRSPRPPNRICSGASRPRLTRFAHSLLERFAPFTRVLRALNSLAP